MHGVVFNVFLCMVCSQYAISHHWKTEILVISIFLPTYYDLVKGQYRHIDILSYIYNMQIYIILIILWRILGFITKTFLTCWFCIVALLTVSLDRKQELYVNVVTTRIKCPWMFLVTHYNTVIIICVVCTKRLHIQEDTMLRCTP